MEDPRGHVPFNPAEEKLGFKGLKPNMHRLSQAHAALEDYKQVGGVRGHS